MKTLEFTVSLSEDEKEQAAAFVRDLRIALKNVEESGTQLSQILETTVKLDAKIANLEHGDGRDEKAAAALNTSRTQRAQIVRSIECAQRDNNDAQSALGVQKSRAWRFIKSACEDCLEAGLRREWNEAVLPFFFIKQDDPRSLDFQFQMSHAKMALKTFFQFSKDADELINLLNTLIEEKTFWSFDGGHEYDKETPV